MALTLHPTLAAAQGSMSRKPIIKLLATQAQESLPFDGEYFNSSVTSEQHNTMFTAADGSVVGLFVRNDATLVQVRTDTNRTFWDETVSPVGYGTIQNITAVELADGNVGVIYTTSQNLRRTVLDSLSNVVAAVATIETLLSPETPTDPAVTMLADGSFLLAYVAYNSSTLAYEIRTRTSADFLSWSAASAVTLTGLLTTRKVANLSMVCVTSGDVLLFFDYVDFEKDEGLTTISNIYSILSADNGATWGTPTQITGYTEWGTSCINPAVSERVTGELALAYTDERKVLSANQGTLLWATDCYSSGAGNATNLHLNPDTGLLYIVQINTHLGPKSLCGVIVIDIATWEVVRNYTTQTSPDYHDVYKYESVYSRKDQSAGSYVVFSAGLYLCVINDTEQTVTEYNFDSDDVYELTENVDINWYIDGEDVKGGRISATLVDVDSKRVYISIINTYLYTRSVLIGYIDLTEPVNSATGKYSWHRIFGKYRYLTGAQAVNQILFSPERNMIIALANSGLPTYTQYPGKTFIIDITSGTILKEFALSTHSLYPHGGLYEGCYSDGCLYASFRHTTIDDQENLRGMVKLNIDTEQFDYYQPTWKTADDYGLNQKVFTGDGRILVAVGGAPGGVASFDMVSGAWYLYQRDTLQGFEMGDPNDSVVISVDYDEKNNQIICGSEFSYGYIGVRMFDEDGSYHMGKLIEGIESAGWAWGTPEDLTLGHSETDQAVAVDPDNVLWSTWTHLDETEYSTKWDRDVKEWQLVDYLVAGESVTLSWSIDRTGTLSFTVSHGHLFDPNNLYSTWSDFLKKGKQIEISLGEKVSGVDYWQTQGKFIIDALHINYVRGQYPTIRVECVSKDFIWGDIQVPATKRYDTNAPEEMVVELLMDIAGINVGAINIPTFPNSHEIHHQWVDVDFRAIIEEVLDHFQTISYFDMDGIFAPKIVNLSGAVANIYTGTEIIRFSPDDNYSSFVNRIVVNGEGLYFLQVTYEEELMETIMGSCGWWENDTKIIKINYSNDLDRVCYDPRLVVLTSIKDFKILWSESGGDEYLSFVDPNNRYCEITVILPGIMDVLIAAIALLIAVGAAAVYCDYTNSCGGHIFALSAVSSGINYILGQVASYHYEVYAKPTGEEKQLVSWTADDTDFQALLGDLVVTESFDDPFCYTAQSCKQVAEHELSIVRAQRSRATFEKIAHLQDEICDRIQIQHPYSKAVLDIFITDLQRTYTRPAGPSDEGGLIDTITGWRL
jgi:hypothetical protein